MSVVRKTKAVKLLLDLFEGAEEALSAVDITQRFHKEMDKTTVYRTLERLEDSGLIHSFADKKGLTRYAKCKDCTAEHHADKHAHFECNACGKVECIPVQVDVPAVPNYRIDSSALLLIGQCDTCLPN